MSKILHSALFFCDKITLFIRGRVDEFGAQYIAFGIFGVINYPVSYLMWHKAMPQIYNPLSFRIAAALFCAPLIFKNYWPLKLKNFLPIYWYFTLFYSLPFFGTYMLLKNHFSIGWMMNNVLASFLLILLVDWLIFIILVTLGIAMGWFIFWITGGDINYPINKDVITLALYMYPFAIIIGTIFSRNKEILIRERLQTIKNVGASIAHELRTPLRSIHAAASSIKDYFPKLMDTYELAKKANLPVPRISHLHYETLLTACDHIESEAEEGFTVIDMLLMNVSESINTRDFAVCSVHQCVDKALRRYPYDKGEAELVHWKDDNDFLFMGNELLIIHILFNLMKNSFYQIKAVRKGEIQIWVEKDEKRNLLHFKDSAKGVSPKVLPNIFEPFYTKTYHGTGVGLAFCKLVMENLSGKITCQSVEGEYAEFILSFPYDPTLTRAEKMNSSNETMVLT